MANIRDLSCGEWGGNKERARAHNSHLGRARRHNAPTVNCAQCIYCTMHLLLHAWTYCTLQLLHLLHTYSHFTPTAPAPAAYCTYCTPAFN